jgi:pyruvate dehydrogenase E2 component (dihydrolipoamide acetyltransferase)
MSDFRMPSLGADMEAGTLVEWLKKPGDPVKRGEIIAVVETQKGAIEIEVFETGVMGEILVQPGTKVPVGKPLARILGPGEAAAPAPIAAAPVAAAVVQGPPQAPKPAVAPVAPSRPSAPGARPLASPAARRLAAERGIDLAGIAGSGPGGAVVSTDLAGAARKPAPSRKPGLDLAEMRKAIGAAMARSKREIPHYYLATSIDLSRVTAFLERTNAGRPPDRRIVVGAVLVKAVALALRRAQAFNGFFRDGAFAPSKAVHVGLAVALRGGGLVAPAIHDTDTLDLDSVMAATRDLVERSRAGRLRGSEMTDPTITLTALGERGVDSVVGVIFPPQVAIIGFGRPALRPWVFEGRVEPRQIVQASLAADHRVSDGHAGALFLADIDRLLQEPEKL